MGPAYVFQSDRMLPPVHPGVAYLLYAPIVWRVDDGPPTRPAMLALVIGAVLPDLVDLPLYYFGSAPSTRTVAHSVLVAVGSSGLILLASRWLPVPDRVGTAFAVGYLSHLLADAVWPLVLWIPSELRYLGWPLTQQPLYEASKPLITIGGTTITTVGAELALLTVAILRWWRDGKPGL